MSKQYLKVNGMMVNFNNQIVSYTQAATPALANPMFLYNNGGAFDITLAGSGDYQLITNGGSTITQTLPGSPTYTFTVPSNPVKILSNNITSLNFTNSNTSITDIDLSGNTNLSTLNISNCALMDLNISNTKISLLTPAMYAPGTLLANNITSTSFTINGGFYIFQNMTFSSSSLLLLSIIGGTMLNTLSINGCPNLTAININFCSALSTLNISNNTNLVSITGDSSLALDTSALDSVLSTLVTHNKNNGYCNLTGSPSSPTNGLSNASRLTLVSRGWTVLVNS